VPIVRSLACLSWARYRIETASGRCGGRAEIEAVMNQAVELLRAKLQWASLTIARLKVSKVSGEPCILEAR